jgi:hypothetical protein
MSTTVVHALQRLFFRSAANTRRPAKADVRKRTARKGQPDFTDTRPVVFRSEAFAEDLRGLIA